MVGYKRDVTEGGVRNFLAVKGPGVAAGVVDSTLLDVVDIMPTVMDLAGGGLQTMMVQRPECSSCRLFAVALCIFVLFRVCCSWVYMHAL